MPNTAQTSFTDGSKSLFEVGSTPAYVYLTKFEWEQDFDEHDTTTTGTTTMSSPVAHKTQILGMSQLKFSGEGKFDITAPIYTTLQAGQTPVTNLKWIADNTVTTPIINVSIPSATINNCKITNVFNDVVTFTFTGKSNGAYTLL